MALRLRYHDKSVQLTSGQLFVGRSAECQIVTGDPLASRRHAVITMSKAGAFVSDLGSRAGVQVNGEPVLGARKLSRGDAIQISSLRIVVEELHVEVDEDEPTDPRLRSTIMPPTAGAPGSGPAGRLAPTPPLGIPRVIPSRFRDTLVDLSHADEDDEDDSLNRTQEAPRASSPGDPPRPTLPGDPPPSVDAPRPTLVADPPRDAPSPSSRDTQTASSRDAQAGSSRDTQTASSRDAPAVSLRDAAPPTSRSPASDSALRAVAILAEKAMALGRAEEAERILQRALTEAIESARRPEADPASAELAASLAARLATATGSGRWFDASIGVYRARAEVPPAPVVDLLFAAAHKVKSVDKALFREYVAAMKAAAGDSPARRFLIQRLEGLRGIVDLK